ncbi:PepSY domain-containing protein [Nitratireductor sp. B36]|uniref:PepSY-associated TM helix domain-containing protein n=1 Tax=Nitratireductor sp. B36 TaxID=2762059 RepID=UPI001E32C2A0|nr:PepSY domain-containing protein [Nitratireductor sp. B36]MCC5781083.1 PepSY domain-containing protein [Nitratireductor sp. B36]
MSNTNTQALPGLPTHEATGKTLRRKLYLAAWRWHFYAGLYVAPFLAMLAITGLIMLWVSAIDGRDGEKIGVTPQGAQTSILAQASAAQTALHEGHVVEYIAPTAADRAAVFRVDSGGEAMMVAVDPYTAEVLDIWNRQAGWYDFASDIHGTLLIGDLGDRLIEIAAGFGIVLIVTGLYLWWPRDGQGPGKALRPDFGARGRSFWKSLHKTVGLYTALILFVFLISGLSWAGVWGEKFVQAWSTFPAEKWDNVPLSDKTHASLNHGATKDVPWALEQTPLPASGSDAGRAGLPASGPFNLDEIVAFGRSLGYEGRFRVATPRGDTGVWTLAQDSMSNDSTDPASDRTVHIDQYTGNILADVGFADYSPAGKAMAVGIAFHEGDMGLWNLALNTVFCLSVIFLSISGLVMWWMRRPSRALRLAAPPLPANLPLWKGAVVVMLLVSLLFPLVGITLLALLALDVLVIQRVKLLARLLA